MRIKNGIILFLLFTALALASCSSSRMSKQQRQAAKMEKQMRKENKKQVDAYLQHHYDIQPESTKKMMKASKKRAKKVNKQRQESFVSRLFRRNRSAGCNGN